jgi:hypothetical protein
MDAKSVQVLLAILAVEEVAHGLPSGLVRLSHRLAFVGVHTALRYGIRRFGGATLRAAIGETGFIRLQLELFFADDTDFDRKCHTDSILRRWYANDPIHAGVTIANCHFGRGSEFPTGSLPDCRRLGIDELLGLYTELMATVRGLTLHFKAFDTSLHFSGSKSLQVSTKSADRFATNTFGC